MRALLVAVACVLSSLAAPSAAYSSLDYRGAQVHPWWNGQTTDSRERELDKLEEAGATTVRMDMPWAAVEPDQRGVRDEAFLARVDTFLAAARARGIKPIMTLHSTPCWASSAPAEVKGSCEDRWGEVNWYPPSRVEDLGEIARFLAARYGSDLAALEVWNEPNLPNFLAPHELTKSERADRYADMLAAVYAPAKQADPDLPILGGSIEGTDDEFLEQLYARGLRKNSDGISFHPYNGPREPDWERPSGWDPKYDFRGGIPRMRATMEANGDDAPVWLTEFGWTTCANGEYRCVTEADQATYTARALDLVRSSYPYVRAAVAYELRDLRAGNCSECRFGLLRGDFTPKPAWGSFERALTSSAGASGGPASARVSSRCLHGRGPGGPATELRRHHKPANDPPGRRRPLAHLWSLARAGLERAGALLPG